MAGASDSEYGYRLFLIKEPHFQVLRPEINDKLLYGEGGDALIVFGAVGWGNFVSQ